MTNNVDLTGKSFGWLTVLSKGDLDKTGKFRWLCQCACGNTVYVAAQMLIRRRKRSCGCVYKTSLFHEKRITDKFVGKRFGKWLVLSFSGHKGKKLSCLCKCDCGNEKAVSTHSLLAGTSISCGCFRKESNKERSGPASPNWTGGRKLHMGYVLIYKPEHPNADKNGYVLEHVFVMSEILGRPIEKGENIHHKNGSRGDNSPSNLELWTSHHPKGQRVKDLLSWANEIITKYSPIADKL